MAGSINDLIAVDFINLILVILVQKDAIVSPIVLRGVGQFVAEQMAAMRA